MVTVLDVILLICAVFNIVSGVCRLFDKNELKEKIKNLETENYELKLENEAIKSQEETAYKYCSEFISKHINEKATKTFDDDSFIKQTLTEQLEHIKSASSYETSEYLPQLTAALCEVLDRLNAL